jgi:hypothetical protein
MIGLQIDSTSFKREMQNIIDYSVGFLEGVERGKTVFLKNLGASVVEVLKEFVDSNARVNPAMLQHMYEWYRAGSPDARLFDIDYTVSGRGLSFRSTFRQSTSVKNGSNVPFYDKARIMEYGIPVTISPKKSKVLVFEDNGETVFTRNPVRVENPGGSAAQGSFEQVFDIFFNQYFSQAFLQSSGLMQYLETPVLYKKNLPRGKRGGRPSGIDTGYRWIANAGVRI